MIIAGYIVSLILYLSDTYHAIMVNSLSNLIPGTVASRLHGCGDKSSVAGNLLFMSKLKKIDYVPDGSRLKFIKQTVFTAPDNRQRWAMGEKQIMAKALYQCDCGTTKEVVCAKVKSGHTRSCGCWAKDTPVTKHGYYHHPLYKTFYNIKKRCCDPDNDAYPAYGGRGVKICEEWLKDPIAFVKWGITKGWRSGLQVDKDIIPEKLKIPALLYSPEMCCLATRKEQMNSTRANRKLELNGVIKNLCQWSEITGIDRLTISERLRRGWSVERALTEPVKNYKKRKS